MATLALPPRISEDADEYTQSAPDGSVPTPFPVAERTTSTSRSPSASRARTTSLFDKVKRAISSSRERSTSIGNERGLSQDRRRSSVADNNIAEEGETRGRSGATASSYLHHNPLQATVSSTTSTAFSSLTKSTSRSASRGRLAMGRGGAGNMLPAESVSESNGEESEEALLKARQDRSRSRGRQEEVFVGGRGGRGNMRSESREGSGSRDAPTMEERLRAQQKEREVEDAARAKKAGETKVFMSGRGGAGNFRWTSPPRNGAQ